MKKNNTGYAYNAALNTLTITAAFAKKANQIGSKEYRTLKQYRTDFPDLTVENRTCGGDHARNGIKYENMERYIDKCRDGKKYLSLLNTVRELSKGQSSPYRYVRDWFDANFPNYSEQPEFDADGFIITAANPINAQKEIDKEMERIIRETTETTQKTEAAMKEAA